jgi:branched-chain amino acid transport system substrate-binding protein
VAVGLSAAGFAGMGGPYAWAAGKQPILIGNIEPLSGPYADSGLNEQQGAILANEECNAKGGVLGREIKMIAY